MICRPLYGGLEHVELAPSKIRIRLGPRGEADTLCPDAEELEALAVYAGGRRARQIAPRVYVLW
jgi:hypothetical protein